MSAGNLWDGDWSSSDSVMLANGHISLHEAQLRFTVITMLRF